MDNLFAVITTCTNSCISNSIIDSFLSRSPINKLHAKASRFSTNAHTIDLVTYSDKAPLVAHANTSLQLGVHPVDTPLSLGSGVVGNTRVDNRAALIALLELSVNDDTAADADAGRLISDNQLLLSAYQRLGADGLSRVKGNFQSIFWDDKSKRLCAAIDPFSGRALFYLKLDHIFCIASEAKTLAEVANISPTVNKVAVSQWLSGRPDPNISLFNEISRLPLGSCLEYSEELGVKVTSFWDINPELSVVYKNDDDYKAHFFELLKTSVSNRLPSGDAARRSAVFCQMSGGMDSTSVTAMANVLINGAEGTEGCKPCDLHTLSHRYKNTSSCDESSNINDMIEKLGLLHQHYIDLDQFQTSTFAQLYPTDYDSPGVVLSPKYDQELSLISDVGADVLLTGNGGDETCWGHSASYRSRLFRGELGVINEVVKGCKTLNEPVARSLYKLFMPQTIQHLVKLARNVPVNSLESPPWLTESAVMRVKQEALLFRNPFSASFNPGKHARYEGLKCTSTFNAMRSYQKVASGYGVDVRHPFFDTDLVEFSFAIPEKLLIQGVYPKWLLRKTMEDYLPASVCWNKHKVVFDHHFANLVRSNRVELRKLLAHEGLQDLGLLDNGILLREFDAVVDNPHGYLNVDMLYAILTQLWFQTHCV